MNFEHSYAGLPKEFHIAVQPETAASPAILAWNQELAAELGIESIADDELARARIFSGSTIPAGAKPLAMAYAGHQFGHFSPQLGDGRAALMGEVVTDAGIRYDIQLKGSGRTAFSRGGDGKSWLGPVIREYILSEAMHRLGIPTTRALAAVVTGDTVYRGSAQPGAVFTRIASSHIRVGTFEFFNARRDVDSLRMLADYAIERHYPAANAEQEVLVAFFRSVAERQAALVAHWMAVGFIHGVMNTDNTAISGETIDYGPAAYLDEFRFDKVFSSIDRDGRYKYISQAPIAQWNLARFAETLLMLDAENSGLEAVLAEFPGRYEDHYLGLMRHKLGLQDALPGDAELIDDWLKLLHDKELDYTLSFRNLATRVEATDNSSFGEFESRWRKRLSEQSHSSEDAAALMNAVNPLFIPRNHRVEQAIQAAVSGDYAIFNELNEVLSNPFTEQPAHAHYAEAPTKDERVTQTFCGT